MNKPYDIYKPTKMQVIVPIIVLIITLILGGVMIMISNALGQTHEKSLYKAPGTVNLDLKAGEYTIYLMTKMDYEGKHYDVPEKYDKLKCQVTYNNQILTLSKFDNNYGFGDEQGQGITYLKFEVLEDGNYTLSTILEDKTYTQVLIAVGETDQHIKAVVTLMVVAIIMILAGIVQFLGYLVLNGSKMIYYIYRKQKKC